MKRLGSAERAGLPRQVVVDVESRTVCSSEETRASEPKRRDRARAREARFRPKSMLPSSVTRTTRKVIQRVGGLGGPSASGAVLDARFRDGVRVLRGHSRVGGWPAGAGGGEQVASPRDARGVGGEQVVRAESDERRALRRERVRGRGPRSRRGHRGHARRARRRRRRRARGRHGRHGPRGRRRPRSPGLPHLLLRRGQFRSRARAHRHRRRLHRRGGGDGRPHGRRNRRTTPSPHRRRPPRRGYAPRVPRPTRHGETRPKRPGVRRRRHRRSLRRARAMGRGPNRVRTRPRALSLPVRLAPRRAGAGGEGPRRREGIPRGVSSEIDPRADCARGETTIRAPRVDPRDGARAAKILRRRRRRVARGGSRPRRDGRVRDGQSRAGGDANGTVGEDPPGGV